MSSINLLPWRVARQQFYYRGFVYVLFLACLLGLLAVYVMHLWLENQLHNAQQLQAVLQAQINNQANGLINSKQLDQQQQALIKQFNQLNNLQRQRWQAVTILTQIITALPNAVRLSKIVFSKQQVLIQGQAMSNKAVSELLRNLDTVAEFTNPSLLLIEAQLLKPSLLSKTLPQPIAPKIVSQKEIRQFKVALQLNDKSRSPKQ